MGLDKTPGTWQSPSLPTDFTHLKRLQDYYAPQIRSLPINPDQVLNTRDFLIQFCRDEDSNISVAGAERIVDHLIRQGWLSNKAYLTLGVDPDVPNQG